MHWIFKNKDHAKIAATASIGLITLWDIEGGLPQVDKYQYSKDPYVVGGAALAVGLTCTRVAHENDPAFALLFDACGNSDPVVQLPAILGMGLAYADTNKVPLSGASSHTFPCHLPHDFDCIKGRDGGFKKNSMRLQGFFCKWACQIRLA